MKYRPRGSCYIRGKCIVQDCDGPQRYKGKYKGRKYYEKYCEYHHRVTYNIKSPGERSEYMIWKEDIPNGKCKKCGWDKGPCDRHRFDNTKGYVPENVIVLCPNCHRLVHYNLINL